MQSFRPVITARLKTNVLSILEHNLKRAKHYRTLKNPRDVKRLEKNVIFFLNSAYSISVIIIVTLKYLNHSIK